MKTIKRAISILLIAFCLLMILTSCGRLSSDVYMFADLEECHAIAADESIQACLTIYESPEKDKHIKELEYVDFFACYYASDDLEFELFAYQFAEADAASVYFSNVVGRKSTYGTDFLKSAGMFSYHGIVISDNMAYAVYSKPSSESNLNELLGDWFTQKVVYSDGKGQLQPKGE